MTAQPDLAAAVSKRAARKAKRASKPAPTETQQMFALMGGFFAGIVLFAVVGALLIMNAPA